MSLMDKNIMFETQGITESNRILYTPSEFVKKTSFYVQEAGHLTSLSSHRSVRDKLDSYLLLQVNDGSGTITIDGQNYHLMKGDTALIDCNRPYEHISDEEELWTLSWVHFNGSMMHEYYNMISKYCHGGMVFRFELKIDELVDDLLSVLKDHKFENELKAAELLHHFLNGLLKRVMISDSKESESDFNQIREKLNQTVTMPQKEIQKNIDTLVKECGVGRQEFFSEFENRFGIGVDSYIEQRKLTKAKEMLRFTTQSEEDVAKSIGINDIQYFISLFYKHENCCPTEYRQCWAQWIRK